MVPERYYQLCTSTWTESNAVYHCIQDNKLIVLSRKFPDGGAAREKVKNLREDKVLRSSLQPPICDLCSLQRNVKVLFSGAFIALCQLADILRALVNGVDCWEITLSGWSCICLGKYIKSSGVAHRVQRLLRCQLCLGRQKTLIERKESALASGRK